MVGDGEWCVCDWCVCVIGVAREHSPSLTISKWTRFRRLKMLMLADSEKKVTTFLIDFRLMQTRSSRRQQSDTRTLLYGFMEQIDDMKPFIDDFAYRRCCDIWKSNASLENKHECIALLKKLTTVLDKIVKIQ